MAVNIEARKRDGQWQDGVSFRARGVDSGIRTAARKLGLKPPTTWERVGNRQWSVNCDGIVMMVVAHEVAS